MTVAFPDFPDVDPLAVDVLGARPGRAPGSDDESIEIAVEGLGEDPQVFSLSICAAYELREALDEALEAPFWWDEATDEEREVAAIASKAGGAMRAGGIIDLVPARSRHGLGGEPFSLQPLLDGSIDWDEARTPSRR